MSWQNMCCRLCWPRDSQDGVQVCRARKEPWGERGIESFQVRYLEMGGLRHTGWFHFKLNLCHQRWCSKLASLSLHPFTPLVYGVGWRLLLWFRSVDLGTGFLPSLALPRTTPPSNSRAVRLSVSFPCYFWDRRGWMLQTFSLSQCCSCCQRSPGAAGCLLAAPPGSAWCGCKVEGRVDVTPDYTGEQWCVLEEMSCSCFLALPWQRSPLPGKGRGWRCPPWKGSAREADACSAESRGDCWWHCLRGAKRCLGCTAPSPRQGLSFR